jgi:hypothetical protein
MQSVHLERSFCYQRALRVLSLGAPGERVEIEAAQLARDSIRFDEIWACLTRRQQIRNTQIPFTDFDIGNSRQSEQGLIPGRVWPGVGGRGRITGIPFPLEVGKQAYGGPFQIERLDNNLVAPEACGVDDRVNPVSFYEISRGKSRRVLQSEIIGSDRKAWKNSEGEVPDGSASTQLRFNERCHLRTIPVHIKDPGNDHHDYEQYDDQESYNAEKNFFAF